MCLLSFISKTARESNSIESKQKVNSKKANVNISKKTGLTSQVNARYVTHKSQKAISRHKNYNLITETWGAVRGVGFLFTRKTPAPFATARRAKYPISLGHLGSLRRGGQNVSLGHSQEYLVWHILEGHSNRGVCLTTVILATPYFDN